MADPKAAPLADDVKEYALTFPTAAFPKNFFCTLCSQLAIDSYKLLCCNKAICASCQEKLVFPTTCPSCDHSPLEADSCTPNKALRNTMRVWLQKQKKKEDKAAAQAPATPVDTTPAAPHVQPAGEAADEPVKSVEEVPKAGTASDEQNAAETSGDAHEYAGPEAARPSQESTAPQNDDAQRRASNVSQHVTESAEPSATDATTDEQNAPNGPNSGMAGNNPMMNGMSGQMGYGFPNQAGFNNGMGYGMNGMPNMMGNGGWNGMNSMDFNSMNGMYGNFGGNMGMGMNDMSAMNYGGGYGGWNGMGGGYGNYNGFNQMGGYNQSGSYPEMMNQFPKNNFPNQNQNRFPANQGGAYPQRNMRNGSKGSFGPGFTNATSRPGSRSGPAPNQRDGQSPDGNADDVSNAKPGSEQKNASSEQTEEGKDNDESTAKSIDAQAAQTSIESGDATEEPGDATDATGDQLGDTMSAGGLKPIQTFDSGDVDTEDYSQSIMENGMPYRQGMMNEGFDQPHMDLPFDTSMTMGYNAYGSRGGFNNNGAYGAAKVLTEQPAQPTGVGVVGAPTGPRAMREGRPNTGFSSRVNSARFAPPPKSLPSTNDAVANSPQRRLRSRSPQRDENLRIRHKSTSRSRSRSRERGHSRAEERRERSKSADYTSRREERHRSLTPTDQDDHERRRERRDQHQSRYDDGKDHYDERPHDDKGSRGDRTRSASVDSKHRGSRRDKDKYRSSRSHRDRSKEHRRRHRSRSPAEGKYDDEDAYANGEKESDGSQRRKHRSDKDKYRERSRDRDRERDRKDRKDRDRDYDHDYERSRDKDKDRKRRRDREADEDERVHDEDKYRSSRRSRKDRDRERPSRYDARDREEHEYEDEKQEKASPVQKDREEDVVSALMTKRAVSPPFNAPTGPAANGFSIKGRSKNVMPPPPPVQPPTGPRAFQPPKGPAADRNRDRNESKDHRRRSSTASNGIASTSSKDMKPQDHYAAERERNARERDSRERVDKTQPAASSKSIHSRISSSSRPSLSTKRSHSDLHDDEPEAPRGPKADTKPPSGPSSHRDKRRKSGTKGDDSIANLFTAGLRKNAKRRGGVRLEGDAERDVERVERERDRR